jgi:SpoVK/Ycf46/Vps4 family AAA+-type ATPase
LFEDLDAIISEHGEDEILQLLDGESAIDKCLNIATTNYPENLDKRLVARPRRFDRVIQIGMPSAEVRKLYFQKKLNVTDGEIEKWVKSSEGFSFAACAELVISICCFEKPFETAVKDLKEMMSANVSSRDYDKSQKLGFSTNS